VLCRLTVRLAHRRCEPPLAGGPGGAPRIYNEESLLLLALLHTLRRLSFLDMHDWLHTWTALALACGLPLSRDGQPRIPSASQQWKRAFSAGTPACEALFVLSVLSGIRRQLISAHDLIIDSPPILGSRRADPNAAVGHASAQHPHPLIRVYHVHTLHCRGSDLPFCFLLSQPMPKMRPLLARSWDGPCVSTPPSSHHPPGFTPLCMPLPSFLLDPRAQARPCSLLGGSMSLEIHSSTREIGKYI
jgi:hypothetical protein